MNNEVVYSKKGNKNALFKKPTVALSVSLTLLGVHLGKRAVMLCEGIMGSEVDEIGISTLIGSRSLA